MLFTTGTFAIYMDDIFVWKYNKDGTSVSIIAYILMLFINSTSAIYTDDIFV